MENLLSYIDDLHINDPIILSATVVDKGGNKLILGTLSTGETKVVAAYNPNTIDINVHNIIGLNMHTVNNMITNQYLNVI